MSDSEPEFDPDRTEVLQGILDLIASAGYSRARIPSVSPFDKLAGGLAWCIAATHAVDAEFHALCDEDLTVRDKINVGEVIEAALRSMKCPYPLQAHQIQGLDYKGAYPVVQWVVARVLKVRAEMGDEIEEETSNIQQLEKELGHAENSIKMLRASLNEQERKKADVLNEIQHLNQEIDKKGANNVVQSLISLLALLKTLERKESDFRSYCKQKRSDMQAEVVELEKNLSHSSERESHTIDFDHSLRGLLEKLNSAKSALAAKLRANLLLKRRLDDVPSQTELIQYERRFSELYVQIQETLRQTRKYYATYNALVEVKELMLKETSLLNSISSQFQDAMISTTGRAKLIDSLEAIVKGTQQKLEKVQLGLHAEQKACDTLKEKYAAAIAEQRHRSSLLKAFQEECARNERLRNLTSV
ncbi:uncharacterized protein LOC131223310 isoform X2 [Magnolia sinica]|uniref:uncharacterized protein LOC131223310 isoform X2 n=1 Tax=Magnolia sinica TaxID=86752 RepID=UPI00265A878E|nr:uncharacterized protein LOC131223310 isoform X2 [Magnolia sinica]